MSIETSKLLHEHKQGTDSNDVEMLVLLCNDLRLPVPSGEGDYR
jgi:hypothetical protein